MSPTTHQKKKGKGEEWVTIRTAEDRTKQEEAMKQRKKEEAMRRKNDGDEAAANAKTKRGAETTAAQAATANPRSDTYTSWYAARFIKGIFIK